MQYVVFDLLWFDGHDLRPLPLSARQDALRDVIDWGDSLVRSEALSGDGPTLLNRACELGWEGLIAKRLASTYQHRRSRDWQKLKCSAQQEVVVGGFTPPRGSRTGFGALLVGVYDQPGAGEAGQPSAGLRYAGKVGTGFDDATLTALHGRLLELEEPDSPFADHVPERSARWVRPELVVEVGFTEWTDGARLRQPRYLGRRPDKHPSEVIREPDVR